MENLTFSLLLENVGVDVRFDYFNASKNVKPSSLAFHSHTVYEVYLIESGSVEVCVGEELLTLRPHDILMIFPNTLHRIKGYSEDFKRFNVRFLLNTPSLPTPDAPYFLYDSANESKQEQFDIIDKIYRHIPHLDTAWGLFRVKSYFGILLSYLTEPLLSSQGKEEKKPRPRTLCKSKLDRQIQIDGFFSENHSRPITVEQLAEELHYSKTHVNRLLRRDFGMSFSEKLVEARLQAARQLLRDTQEPIHVIAERCGYSTLRGFELFFKKHTGMLPKEYRKKTSEG